MTARASHRRSLRVLARAHGVQTGYVGTDGKRHPASDEALVGVLGALGIGIDGPAEAESMLEELAATRARAVLDPVVVHGHGSPLQLGLSVDEDVDPESVWLGLDTQSAPARARRLSELGARRVGVDEIDGRRRSSWHVQLDLADLPLGYSRLDVDEGGEVASCTVVTAPESCPRPGRGWGVSVPLYAVRTARDWGSSSFTELGRLAELVGTYGGSFVATLPLCASFSSGEFGAPSPYLPVSKLVWNETYVDVTALPELGASAEAREMVSCPRFLSDLEALRAAPQFDECAVNGAKQELFRLLARALCDGSSYRRDAFLAYVVSRPELVAYSKFRSECHRRRAPWWGWPPELRRYVIDGDLDAVDDEVALAHLYAQWVAGEQLAIASEREVRMHLDVPVGVHPAGFDPYWAQESFCMGASVGAPPDDFFSGGQIWGCPPLHPTRIREAGYDYVVQTLRHAMTHASSVRLDHVMGLHRTYWVPEGLDARNGAYVRYRWDELYAIVCLEAQLAWTAVVGEDLGTVPGSVRRAMERRGLLRSFVFELVSTAKDPLPEAGESAIASLSTHDLAPFASFWRGMDIDDRLLRGEIEARDAKEALEQRALWRRSVLGRLEEAGAAPSEAAELARLDDEEGGGVGTTRLALAGCLSHISRGAARLVLVDLEDLWLETEPQNRPGTGAEVGNFVRRAERTLDQVEGDPEALEVLAAVNRDRGERSLPGSDDSGALGRVPAP